MVLRLATAMPRLKMPQRGCKMEIGHAPKRKSAWRKAVELYAEELMENCGNDYPTKERLLNGASSWREYSYDGSSLIYDEDIARRTCSPSELKKTRNGKRKPNSREAWLDVQARALYQASLIILRGQVAK